MTPLYFCLSGRLTLARGQISQLNVFKTRVAHPNYLVSTAASAWYSLVIREQQLRIGHLKEQEIEATKKPLVFLIIYRLKVL